MQKQQRVLKLQNAHLKTLLALVGSPTSGTKQELIQTLRTAIAFNRGNNHVLNIEKPKRGRAMKERLTQMSGHSTLPGVQKRILSIDMGIKNLAFCVMNVEEHGAESAHKLHVLAWKRVNLESLFLKTSNGVGETPDIPTDAVAVADAATAPDFSPLSLSRAAYKLLSEHLLPFAPTTILIESQRYRSSGGAGVADWTYRVNLLEGMLWAVLETLKGEQRYQPVMPGRNGAFPLVHAVSPARVGLFWVHPPTFPADKKESESPRTSTRSARSVEKKAKIAVVNKWLSHAISATNSSKLAPESSTTSYNITFPTIHTSLSMDGRHDLVTAPGLLHLTLDPSIASTTPFLDHSGDSDETITTGDNKVTAKSKRRRKAQGGQSKTKLDDLADCFLQAAAWAAWNVNKKCIASLDHMLEESANQTETNSPEANKTDGKRKAKTKARKDSGLV